jgi:hypothetical protein
MVLVDPMHEFAEGVTVMVPVMGESVVFVALKVPIFPFPEAPKPTFIFEFVHAYVVPKTDPEKLIDEDKLLLQIVWGVFVFTFGIGLTFTTNPKVVHVFVPSLIVHEMIVVLEGEIVIDGVVSELLLHKKLVGFVILCVNVKVVDEPWQIGFEVA